MVKKNRVSVAVLGCGRQAWLGFLPWIREHSGATLAAVADIDADQAQRTARKFGAGQHFTDWREMIEKSGAQALIITTPPWFHEEPTVEAAAHGLHVLCEKPMAPVVDACRRMLSACEKAGVVLQIGFSLRFDPGYETLKSLVCKGEIGEVYQLKSLYDAYVPDLTKSPAKEIVGLVGRLRLLNSKDMGIWRLTDERAGGGVFMDHGIHYVDLFRWILDDEVVMAAGAAHHIVEDRIHEDHGSCFLRFASGAAAYVEASQARMSARFEIDEGIVYGSRGDLKWEFDQTWYMRGYPHLYNTHANIWKFGVPSLVTGMWMPVPVPHGRRHVMFRRQFDYFISQINGEKIRHPVFGDSWAADGHDGMRAIQIARAVYESSEKNISIDVSEK